MTEALKKFSSLTQTAIARKASTSLTPVQVACVERLESCVDRVLACKRRDVHLRALSHCVASYSDADRDEPLTADVFAVFELYRIYTQELVYYPEKFDFLIYCIMQRVCLVQKPRQFHELLDDILMPPTAALAMRVGGELLSKLIREDEKKGEDEMARIEAFCLKKDWQQRPSSLSGKKPLKDDEDEDVFLR
jgi:hypothetical protein